MQSVGEGTFLTTARMNTYMHDYSNMNTLSIDKQHDKCAEAVLTFQCTGGVTVCEHMEICESCRVLCCVVFVQCTNTNAPLPLAILFFVQHGYHQLHKICS